MNTSIKNITKLYFQEFDKLVKKYGKRIVVLFQVGGFYECYDYDTPDGGKHGNAYVFHELLGYDYKYEPHTIKKPRQVGFPIHILDKNIAILSSEGYIIAVYNQQNVPGKKTKERVLDEIITPVTNLGNNISNNFLMVVYINEYKCRITHRNRRNSSIVLIDYTTGCVKLYETYDYREHCDKNDNDLCQWMKMYSPVEYVFISETISKNDLVKSLQLDNIDKHIEFHDKNNIYMNKEYIEKTLNEVYTLPETSDMLSYVDYLQLQHHKELLYTLVHAIQYTYKLNKHVVKKLLYPEFIKDENIMTLTNRTIYHLDIFNDNTSLFSICNKTCTPMGSRLLMDRFRHPITDVSILEYRYDEIKHMKEYRTKIKPLLKKIIDIEKKYRKMVIGKIKPAEFAEVVYSWDTVVDIMNLVKTDIILKSKEELTIKFQKIIEFVKQKVDVSKMHTFLTTHQNFFIKEYEPELYDYYDKILYKKELLYKFAKQCSKYLEEKYISVKKHNKIGYYLSVTPSRYKILKEQCKDLIKVDRYTFDIEHCNIDKTKLELKLYGGDITKLSNLIEKEEDCFMDKITNTFNEFIQKVVNFNSDTLPKVIKWVSNIDVVYSGASVSDCYGYTRPIIKKQDNGFIVSKEIRHPIIERLSSDEFIPNDISLGLDNIGTLIYGLNASGKSVYLKTIGCNIVLAQIGYYTSSKEFVYSPFKQIVSRIPQGDDFFRGKSTYEVELEEMFMMFRQAYSDTLVLSDELGSSTEHISAYAMVASMIQYFLKTKTRFVMATHIHELKQRYKQDNNIWIKSFQSYIQDGKLVYKRKLTDENISETYGLEIAEHYGLPKEFIQTAYSIRNEYLHQTNELVPTKTSKYNTKKIVDKCNHCGSKKNLHTHHKKHQSQSNEHGLIEGRIHKNMIHNLEILCEDCHKEEHNI